MSLFSKKQAIFYKRYETDNAGYEICVIGRRPKSEPYLRVGRGEPSEYITSLDARRMGYLMRAIAESLGYKVMKR